MRARDRFERSVKNVSLCNFIAMPQDFLQRLKVFHAALNVMARTYNCTIWTLRTRDLFLPCKSLCHFNDSSRLPTEIELLE